MLDIFLVRHGQSEGNLNPNKYFEMHDSQIPLTQKGYEQARRAAYTIHSLCVHEGKAPFVFDCYRSPYVRTTQTENAIVKELSALGNTIGHRREDPRLREREWGSLRDIVHQKKDTPDNFGFYYKPLSGESFANLYDRAACFDRWLMDKYPVSYLSPLIKGTRKRVIITAHGEFIKIYTMYKLGLSVEEWSTYSHPFNGEVIHFFQDYANSAWQISPKTPLRNKLYEIH